MTATDSIAQSDGLAHTEISSEELARRLDIIGHQLNWLCENMQSLFYFVQQVSSSGGGVRGMLHAIKNMPSEMQLKQQPTEVSGE